MIIGYLTNVGPVPCTVEIPANPPCEADLDRPGGGLFYKSNWARCVNTIEEAKRGINGHYTCLEWHDETEKGKSPPISLAVGDSVLVAVGFMWGNGSLKRGKIGAGFAVAGGYGWWAQHEIRPIPTHPHTIE